MKDVDRSRPPAVAVAAPDTRRRVVLIEDDNDIAEAIVYHLEKAGLQVRVARTGEEGLDAVRKGVDLVLLDLGLPGMDGLEVCRLIRRQATTAHVPIIIVSARADEVDRVLGLEMGADDYVVKPVEPRVLLARVEALLRRAASRQGPPPEASFTVGRLAIDGARRCARLDSRDIDLTTGDFDILWLLASRHGSVVTRDEILRVVRGIDYDGLDRSIDARICRLRRKLADAGGAESMIKTVRLKGYLFTGDA